MGKAKQRHDDSSRLVGSLNSDPDLKFCGENSWVIVKKQKVTILVPSLHVADRSLQLNAEPSQLQALPRKRADNRSPRPTDTCPRMPSVDERKRSLSAASKTDLQLVKKASSAPNIPTLTRTLRQDPRIVSINPNRSDTSKSHKVLGVSKASRTIIRPRPFLHGNGDFPDGGMLLNQRLRALNLERKLQKAGGLSRWLASLGLEQFVRLFQGKSIGKFQLVNLTMKKLKDMGANAVGPRRKLMHAIDCICQPYCFQAL
ncbi:uncharacterized protein LOC21395636 [Morus notabilis]|uniref:uncharacterized protein LOC21395636 n=1 Tax=Morus notabilis TaxID=981085 RepID=UPI000CED7ABC|nr:uncharacterized protein LOC21395636 [Morus notabilis]XP_024027009.1 uncharacterized protein LOC21395636 [Morus notabilis]XP_024027010.1 uncharacterized protein LOC21395636 [Morus notabilis]